MKKDFNVILNNRFTILEDDTELTIESFNKAMEEGGGGKSAWSQEIQSRGMDIPIHLEKNGRLETHTKTSA